MKDKDGKSLYGSAEVNERLNKYFCKLYKNTDNMKDWKVKEDSTTNKEEKSIY